jgi:hypothetical protein
VEIVIVPGWRRPDFLTATLKRLLVADDPELVYWIVLDKRSYSSVRKVAGEFASALGPSRAVVEVCKDHPYRGNSFNVLTAYKRACLHDPKPLLVHLVEEDVFVGADYFDFHRRAHELCSDVFAVSACRLQILLEDPPPDEETLYRWGHYQSIGVSFRLGKLSSIVPHVSHKYFQAPVSYCKRLFPDSKIFSHNAEQDGLINRIVEATGQDVAFPTVPRAYHAGFSGYHRKGEDLKGQDLEGMADQLLMMGEDELNRRAQSYPDHRVIPLDQRRKPVTKVIEWPSR